MKPALFGCVACLAAVPFFPLRAAAGTVPLDVELKVTDEEYHPLAGVPVRLVFGLPDWQAPDAGIRVVSGDDGTVKFTTQAVIERRWSSSNIGFTPFRMPFRADHLSLAAELVFTVPKRDGGDIDHHFSTLPTSTGCPTATAAPTTSTRSMRPVPMGVSPSSLAPMPPGRISTG